METDAQYCKLCDDEIPKARLETLPYTQLCVRCSERVGGEKRIKVTLGNIGKAGSLKKNYGSLDIEFQSRWK
ncbi:MAG: TraR/DksA C4-type zinc finger protein [Acidobacteriota bacterium]